MLNLIFSVPGVHITCVVIWTWLYVSLSNLSVCVCVYVLF